MTENEDCYGDAASSSAEIDLLLRNVSKLPNVAFFVWNEDSGKPIYISRQLPKFYRMSMADFLEAFGTNEKISANMVGEDGKRYLAATRAGMEAASSYDVEFRFYRADGTICFAREVGEYLRNPKANRVLRSVGAVIDITAQKETEQALRRLSSELQESLEYQTATSEILKVISRSAFDLDTVLTSLIRSAIQLCDATRGVIWLRNGEQLFLAAQVGYSEEWIAAVRDSPITPAADAVTTSGLAAFTGEVVHVEDVPNDPRFRSLAAHKLGDYRAGLAVPLTRDGKVEGVISLSRPEARLFTERQVALVQSFADQAVIAIENVRLFDEVQERTAELGEALQQQTATADVPILREGSPVGVFALTRSEVRGFTTRQIELVETFADQAGIAIENVRLFDEVQARTRELARSLEELRTAQDRLVQTEKLASLGQLTAGIAHEIKNPLNFVNNFSSLSAELIDELREVLESAPLDEKTRADVDELTGMLKGNLDKVAQHGKRADSIVKNMLLHSREGLGEHRPVDINAIVEESLNLAYHGARAEKPGFNITLEKTFDPQAGDVDLYPQEVTRVLLNLISNGFYATVQRGAEANGAPYEPVLAASTKNLGDSVEIRIRDNGTGIPPDVKEKMFNPFFTTKPAGEGTGLGLSLSHDIIVKQHAGTIEVDTEQGAFTEFRIVLPRRAASLASSGGPA